MADSYLTKKNARHRPVRRVRRLSLDGGDPSPSLWRLEAAESSFDDADVSVVVSQFFAPLPSSRRHRVDAVSAMPQPFAQRHVDERFNRDADDGGRVVSRLGLGAILHRYGSSFFERRASLVPKRKQ